MESQKQVRVTQRVPRSCTECSRRKIKCSKTVPCTACTRRGDSRRCIREIVRVNGEIKIALDNDLEVEDSSRIEGLLDENRSLRARILELESLIHDTSNDDRIRNHVTSSTQSRTPLSVSEDIHEIFERLHLDVVAGDSSKDSSELDLAIRPHVWQILPTRPESEKIVRFSLSMLGWVHCALDVPSFEIEHAKFWSFLLPFENADLFNDHAWMAIYFSVIAVGIYFMDDGQNASEIHFLNEGFSSESSMNNELRTNNKEQIARVWYYAALSELRRSNFYTTPHLAGIQCLAILMLLHRNFGDSNLEYLNLGLSINAARILHMDRLASEESLSQVAQKPLWETPKKRNLGRRLWWTLVICDWLPSITRPNTIASDSFDCNLSIDTIAAVHTSGPSNLYYHQATAEISHVIYQFSKGLKGRSINRMCKALEGISLIEIGLPAHLSTRSPDVFQVVQDIEVAWVPLQRKLLSMLMDVSRINICVFYIPQYLKTMKDDFQIQTRGLQAAKNIIKLSRGINTSLLEKFWSPPAIVLAAGIFMALDLICLKGRQSNHERDEKRRWIEECYKTLLQMRRDTSHSRDGCSMITRLMQVEELLAPEAFVDEKMLLVIMKQVAVPEAVNDECCDSRKGPFVHSENSAALPSDLSAELGFSLDGPETEYGMDDFDMPGYIY